ncbi:MAG: DNA polymerase I [Rickettsiales bacterium]
MAKSLLLIDGSGFIFRAYHALPPLSDPNGTPVGAVLGFMNMLLKLMESKNPDYVAVVFDAARITFRNEIYPEYKANRPPAPEDLIPQFKLVRDATLAMNLPAVEMENYEADDIIATYTRLAKEQNVEVTIVSSDKDLMQLIDDDMVKMFDAMKNKEIGSEQVVEKFGVTPDKVLEVLSLIGDNSDNVPGVAGIGPKTAAELIGQYGNLENLLKNASDIKQPKRRQTLIDSTEIAKLSKKLITLKDDVELPLKIEELALREMSPDILVKFLQKHGFKSLLAKMEKKFGVEATPPVNNKKTVEKNITEKNTEYTTVNKVEELKLWVERAIEKGVVAFDTETTSLSATQAELVGFSLCVEEGKACYVPLAHKVAGNEEARTDDLFRDSVKPTGVAKQNTGQISIKEALTIIKPLLEDESVLKIGQNIKYDMLVLRNLGINIKPVDDTMLLSYALNAGTHSHGMDELAKRYLGITTIKYDDVTGTGKNRIGFEMVDIKDATNYAAEDADVTMRLWNSLKPNLIKEKLVTLYETIERPLSPVLVKMEEKGIKVSPLKLAELSKELAKKMAEYEQEIYKLAGREFNIASPKQLGEILFDEMAIEGGKKSAKSGAYSTDSKILEDLADKGYELPKQVLNWRQLAKLKNTYTDSLAQQINPKTGRIHTSFAMAIASTGRLSSSDPNLQNIPIRSDEGKKIRESFIAKDGFVLLSADYSQIELRLLAHIADIGSLKEAFKNGDDVHAITASQMFGVPLNEVNSDLRRKAKTINFGIIYGISAHGLATRLGIGRTEAKEYIDKYFVQYSGIRDYMEDCREFARKHGYVNTLFGRRCHLPDINDKNAARRQFSERAAINAPLQGTAADIIKLAMINIDSKLKNEKDIDMLLQVHDELIFEVRENYVAKFSPIIKNCMENAASLSVPLTAQIGTGSNWSEAH